MVNEWIVQPVCENTKLWDSTIKDNIPGLIWMQKNVGERIDIDSRRVIEK